MNGKIRIAFLGDISGNGICGKTMIRVSAEKFFRPVIQILKDCDFVVANFEGCIIEREAAIASRTKTQIASDPSVISALQSLGVSAVSFANNHSFDFGSAEWARMSARLEEAGITNFGAGRSTEKARIPWVGQHEVAKVVVFGYADPECGGDYSAERSGGVNEFDLTRACTEIRQAKESGDFCFVVVFIHWGEERILLPAPRLRTWAREMVAAGADLVIGHHPHVLQGYEKIDGSYVFYSLGNFFMADIVERDRVTVKYCRDNHLSVVPVFELKQGCAPKLVRLSGFRCDGRTFCSVSGNKLMRYFRRWNPGMLDKDYARRFTRHQDFMWRYYIPIRYRLLLDPVGTISRLGVSKILRILGHGRSPWKEKS